MTDKTKINKRLERIEIWKQRCLNDEFANSDLIYQWLEVLEMELKWILKLI